MNLVLKSDRHTHEMATTHIWFLSPCVGPGGLSGVATSEAEAQVLGQGHSHDRAPRDTGEEGVGSRKGAGAGSACSASFNTWA